MELTRSPQALGASAQMLAFVYSSHRNLNETKPVPNAEIFLLERKQKERHNRKE